MKFIVIKEVEAPSLQQAFDKERDPIDTVISVFECTQSIIRRYGTPTLHDQK